MLMAERFVPGNSINEVALQLAEIDFNWKEKLDVNLEPLVGGLIGLARNPRNTALVVMAGLLLCGSLSSCCGAIPQSCPPGQELMYSISCVPQENALLRPFGMSSDDLESYDDTDYGSCFQASCGAGYIQSGDCYEFCGY